MNQVRRRGLVPTIMSIVLLVALSGPVAATVSKTGTKYCPTNETPYARSYSTGFTELYPPGQGYKTYNNGSTWTVRKWHANSAGGGGWWGVYVTGGSLSDSGTYAGCTITGI